jgi:hypothetical protein
MRFSKWRLRPPKVRQSQLCTMTEGKPNFGEYHRQGMACLTLANLSDVPDIQARWLMMSRTWFELAQKADEPTSQNDPSNVVHLKSR